jgi:hypothetical protein
MDSAWKTKQGRDYTVGGMQTFDYVFVTRHSFSAKNSISRAGIVIQFFLGLKITFSSLAQRRDSCDSDSLKSFETEEKSRGKNRTEGYAQNRSG